MEAPGYLHNLIASGSTFLNNLAASGSTFLNVLCGGPREPIFGIFREPIDPCGIGEGYWHNLVASFSTFVNVLRGGPYEPVCTTLHDSIEAGGKASRVPWPARCLAHFRYSAGK